MNTFPKAWCILYTFLKEETLFLKDNYIYNLSEGTRRVLCLCLWMQNYFIKISHISSPWSTPASCSCCRANPCYACTSPRQQLISKKSRFESRWEFLVTELISGPSLQSASAPSLVDGVMSLCVCHLFGACFKAYVYTQTLPLCPRWPSEVTSWWHLYWVW